MAHGDIVHEPDGKEAFRKGTVAFFQDVAQRRAAADWPSSRALLAAGVVAVVVAAAWRLKGTWA